MTFVRAIAHQSKVWFGPPDRKSGLEAEILSRLVLSARNHSVVDVSAKELRLKDVAEFLASLSQCGQHMLAKTVKTGLGSLGIERRERGRPMGRDTDHLYATYVELIEAAIKDTGVFAVKLKMREKYSHNWQRHFERFLQREKWPKDSLHLVSRGV